MAYTYPPMVAYDMETLTPLRSGGAGVIVDELNQTLSITDLADIPKTQVVINEYALTEPFKANVPEAFWKSGDILIPLSSPQGLREAAEAAALAAQEAANNAGGTTATDSFVASLISDTESTTRAALDSLIGSSPGSIGPKVFPVRYVGAAWEYGNLAAAEAAGLNATTDIIMFVGPVGTEPPTWSRDYDTWVRG